MSLGPSPERVLEAQGGLPGQVFTPPALARRLARGWADGRGLLDPACGDGALLLAALEGAGGRPGFALERLHGIELDPRLAERARQRLRAACGAVQGSRAWDVLGSRIRCGDALDPDTPWPEGTWVLANPPWVSFSGREAARPGSGAQPVSEGGWPSLQGAFAARVARHVADQGTGARLLLPASVTELEGYGEVRRRVTELARLPEPPEELGEAAFPGVTEPAVIVELRSGSRSGSGGSDEAWTRPSPVAAGLLEELSRFPCLPAGTFADPGVHTGNASAELIVRAGGEELPGVREGRCLAPYDLGPPVARLRVDLAPSPERRFRIRELDHYRSFPVLLRQTADRPLAALHHQPGYFRNSLLAARPVPGLDPAFVAAVLNGPLAALRHRLSFRDARQRSFPQVKVGHLAGQPFPIEHRDQAPGFHDEVVARVRSLEPSRAGFAERRGELDRLVLDGFELDPGLFAAATRSAAP